MKVLIKYFCFFGLIAWSSYLFAGNSKFQVRLELDEKEAKTVPHEIFSYTAPNGRNMDISVAKEIILSVEDVQDASIKLQEDRLKEIPDGFYTVGEDGFKVLTYTEEDKLI